MNGLGKGSIIFPDAINDTIYQTNLRGFLSIQISTA